MQENVTIFKADTTDAIKSVQDLRQHIKDLQDSLVNMEKDTEAYDKAVEDLVASQTKLNEVMSITRKNVGAAEGSYNNLVNQMNALKTAWRATTSEVQRAQLGEKIRAINDQLKEYDATIGNHQRKVGSYEEAIQALTKTYDSQKQELAALKTALDNLEPGSEAYNEAFERASEITHNLQERQEMLRKSANDLGTQLGNVMSIGTGLVSGFNAINAIMALTGQKNENLQKTMVKLQAGIALVQSAKGLEGAVKSLKAYANWAAKAYDSIVDWISGSKKQQKQIEATTTATEKNAAANTQNAVAEKSAAAGAQQLSAGMKSTATSTAAATSSMVAFKAVLVSLGIGVAIAVITGLVTAITKLTNAGDEAYKKSLEHSRKRLELEDALRELEDKAAEEAWNVKKAAGENEIKLAKEKYDYYDQRIKDYTEQIKALEEYEESWQGKVYKFFEGVNDHKVTKRDQKDFKDITGMDLSDVQAELEKMADEGNRYFMQLEKDSLSRFEAIRDGAKVTTKDMYMMFDMYRKASMQQFKQDKEELSNLANELEVQVTSALKTAQDAVKSEGTLENERYEAERQAVSDYYDSISAETTVKNAALRDLELAHRKKMSDIVTAATQSILETAHNANLTEIQQLDEKYQKELKILRQYGRDTTELTKAYDKERAQLVYKEELKARERAVTELERFASQSGPMQEAYNELLAMGIAYAKDLAAAQEEEYENIKFSLEQQYEYWKKMWEQYENDTRISLDDRLALQEKYLNAKNALEKNETDYLLKQIKTRKQALDEEIARIEKNYSNVSSFQSLNTEAKYTGKTGLGSTWWGASQQPSYSQQKDDLNGAYDIQASRLQQEIEYYQYYAQEIAKTDAEITYAREQEAQKRMELATLERENYLDNLHIEIDESKEIISTIVDVGNSIGSILGSVADAWQDSVEAQVKAGDMSQEEADKQMENVRALQIVQATINMLAGSFGAFAQASSTIPPPYGQIVGAAAAAAVIAQGIAQIAAIRNAGKNSGSGGSTMMAQVTPVMTDYQPEYVANATGEQETERLANALASTPIWVSVQDIDAAQEKGRTRVAESTF